MSEKRAMALPPPPLSREFHAAAATPAGVPIIIRATRAECEALAQANGLCAVNSFEADLRVSRWGEDGVEVVGVVRANVRQNCVVTLEEFDAVLEEPIRLRFAPAPAPETPKPGAGGGRSHPRAGRSDEAEVVTARILDLDADEPDEFIGGVVDLGAAAAEFFTLGLDPHPRRPGAAFIQPEEPESLDNPFAPLLRGTDQKGRKSN